MKYVKIFWLTLVSLFLIHILSACSSKSTAPDDTGTIQLMNGEWLSDEVEPIPNSTVRMLYMSVRDSMLYIRSTTGGFFPAMPETMVDTLMPYEIEEGYLTVGHGTFYAQVKVMSRKQLTLNWIGRDFVLRWKAEKIP